MGPIRLSARYAFAFAASVAVCSAAAYPVFSQQVLTPPPPKVTPPLNILNVHSVVREAAAVCDPLVAGPFDSKRLPKLLQFNHLASVSPERVPHIPLVVAYMAKMGVRVCFDQRMAGMPYSSALFPQMNLIALNPLPKGYFNSPGHQEMALFDAVEHLTSLYNHSADTPLPSRTLTEVNFVTFDPKKPDDSRRSQDSALAVRFSPPVVSGTTAARVTKPLLPSGRLM